MARSKYATTPPLIETMPKGVPYIVGNEGAERFSFYGMRAILTLYMTHLFISEGIAPELAEVEATKHFHSFMMAVYLTPFFGALLSDIFLGKYRTIIALSLVYCAGHLVLSINDIPLRDDLGLSARWGLALGLGLISVGAGGIKPCVSAHVGDQFGVKNQHLISKVFSWFYFSINLGAMVSMMLTPWLRERFGPGLAFGVPAVLMFIATIVFWMGRYKFVHIQPKGWAVFDDLKDRDVRTALLMLVLLFYPFVAIFWSLFDQTGSTWIHQATRMDPMFLGRAWLPDQIQAINSFFILILIPFFAYVVYPLMNKVFEVTARRKIAIGLFLASVPFFMNDWLETAIRASIEDPSIPTPSIAWQILQYFILTSAEVMVSITGLEYSYTQAPKALKSFVMGLWFLSVSIGNYFTSLVNGAIERSVEAGEPILQGASYFNFFAWTMVGAAVIFTVVTMRYKERHYIQGSEAPE